jgi:molecular chaperone DnaK
MSKVIGIDLGTTNSCVAIVESGKTVVIPNSEGGRTTPSVVALADTGEWLVGQIARRQAVTNPKRTVFAVKRLIGRRFDTPEAQQAVKSLPYEVVSADNGDAWVRLSEREVSPPEISAHVLRKMRESAEDYLGEEVRDAVITVPAYFNDRQRQATKDAGKIAGLNVLRIVNEPTAAAIAYGLHEQHSAKVAVFDLGGGTFDISVLQIGDGVIDVLSTSGDTYLGGEDFDGRLIDWMAERFQKEHGVDLRVDAATLQRLKEAAEKAKCDLSSIDRTRIELPFISSGTGGPKHLSYELTRAELERLTEDLIERTLGPCKTALADAGLQPKDLDMVLLVGGQTRMPLVKSKVEAFFGRKPSEVMNPDEVVACGAAVQAGILRGEVEEVLLLDVTPLSLGVETAGGVFTKIITRNTSIPCMFSQVFSTSLDNQSMVSIHVLQGERPLAADNHSLARFDLLGIPPAPRGVPQIEVTFNIDAEGLVSVSAKELGTGKESKVKVTASGGLSDDEVDQMVDAAEQYAEEDRGKKAVVDLKNRAKGLIYTTEKSLPEYQQVLGDEAMGPLHEALEHCRGLAESAAPDPAALEEAIALLEESAYKLVEALYGAGEGEAPQGEVEPALEESTGDA